MSYLFQVDFQDGSGYRNITNLVKFESIKKTDILWSKLSPSIGTIEFELMRDTSFLNLLLTEEAEPIVNVTENGSAFFQGYIRPNYDITVNVNNIGDTKIECVDNGYRLQKKIDSSFQLNSYKVCDTSTPASSIIHYLLDLAGYDSGEINVSDIDKTIDYFPIIRGDASYFNILKDLLFEFGYIFYHDESGDFRIYNFLPDDTTTSNVLGNTAVVKNIEGEFQIRKSLEDFEGVDISWYNHESISGAIVFSDTSGGNANLKCNIAIPAGEFYPYADGSIESFAEYKMNGREIITVISPSLSVTKDADIVTNTFTNQYQRAIIEFENTGGVTRYITKLDIVGTAIVKGNLGIEKRRNVVKTEKIFEYELKYSTLQADAQKLAIGLARYYRYSDFIYLARSRDEFSIGDFVDIEDDYLGIDNRCVIVEKVTSFINESTKVFVYKLDGISEYTAESLDSEIIRTTPPPVELGSTGDLIEQVPTYSEVIEGFAFGGGTKTPTQVTVSECRAVGVRSILLLWDRQLNLTNFDRYEIQVSDNDSTWYSLKFDGTDWKDTVDEVTECNNEFLIHSGIPLTGDSDDPSGQTLYYRVRRVTKEPLSGTWSASVSATSRAVNSGELAAESIYANNFIAGVIDTLLLYVDTALYVGYNGTGSTVSPDEGDRRLYVDGDEIKFQVYTNGGWSVIKSIVIGGLIAGIFASFIGCNGIYHPENPPQSIESFPDKTFLVFDFENSLADQNGDTSFWSNSNSEYSSSIKKFDDYSLAGPATGVNASIFSSASFLKPSDSFTIGFWFYVDSGYDVSEFYKADILFMQNSYSDIIRLSIDPDLNIVISIAKDNVFILDDVITGLEVSVSQWQYISFSHDTTNDKILISVNDLSYSSGALGGTWGDSDDYFSAVYLYTRRYSSSFYDARFYIDDLCISKNTVNLDLFFQHYLGGIKWNTAFSASDILLKPGINGRIIFDDNQNEPSCGTLHLLAEADRPSSWVLNGGTASTFTEVDFSTYVPFGVKALLLRATFLASATNECRMYFRPSGSSVDDFYQNVVERIYFSNTGAYDLSSDRQFICGCFPDGKIEYKTVYGALYLTIVGYYI
jgi:hypothetical protein